MNYQDFQENKGKKKKAPHKNAGLTGKWVFKNPNRRILLGRQEITSYDLEVNQDLAQILIDKGLSDLICQK